MTDQLKSLLLVLFLLTSSVAPAFAADGTPDPEPNENWTDGPGNATDWSRHGMPLNPYLALWSKDADRNRPLGAKRAELMQYMNSSSEYNMSEAQNIISIYQISARADPTFDRPPQRAIDIWNAKDGAAYSLSTSDQTSFVPQGVTTRDGGYVKYANGSRTAVIRDAFIHEKTVTPMTIVHLKTTVSGDQLIERYVANGDTEITSSSALIDYWVKEPQKTAVYNNKSIAYKYKNSSIDSYRVADSDDCSFDETSCDWGRTNEIPNNQIPNTSYKINISNTGIRDQSFDHQARINVTLKKTVKYCKENKDDDGDGVPNYKDECPNTAGEKANGCTRDSDGDGIRDYYDNCDYKADGEGKDGCYIDSDGDGGYDHEDGCDTEAGPASNNYCPETDSGGSGGNSSDGSGGDGGSTDPCSGCWNLAITPSISDLTTSVTSTIGSLLPSVSLADVSSAVSPLFIPLGDAGVIGQLTPSVSTSAQAAPSLSCDSNHHVEKKNSSSGIIHRQMVVTEETNVWVNSLSTIDTVYRRYHDGDYLMYLRSSQRWTYAQINDANGIRTGWAFYTQRSTEYDNLTKHSQSSEEERRGPMQPMEIHAVPDSAGPTHFPASGFAQSHIINYSTRPVEPPELGENIETGVAATQDYSQAEWVIYKFEPGAGIDSYHEAMMGQRLTVNSMVYGEERTESIPYPKLVNRTTLTVDIINQSPAQDQLTIRVNLTNKETGEPIDLQNLTYEGVSWSSLSTTSSFAAMNSVNPPFIVTNTGEYLYTNESGMVTTTIDTSNLTDRTVKVRFVPKKWWTLQNDEPAYLESQATATANQALYPNLSMLLTFLTLVALYVFAYVWAGRIFGVRLSPTRMFHELFGRK